MTATRTQHVPQRSCVACRRKQPKRALIRLAQTADGAVAVDERASAPGRGAYLCGDPACWQRALAGTSLARALRVPLTAADRATLEAYARGLAGAAEARSAAAGELAGEAAGGGRGR